MKKANGWVGFFGIIFQFSQLVRQAVTIARRTKYPEIQIGTPAKEKPAHFMGAKSL
jgi:hypothetical protein